MALWKIISDEDAVLIPKLKARTFPVDFCTQNFLRGGKVSRFATTPLIVAVSLGHSDITRFHPWSPIVTGNHLDHTEKIPKVPQTTFFIHVQAYQNPLR